MMVTISHDDLRGIKVMERDNEIITSSIHSLKVQLQSELKMGYY
jgi:hypothetical protein